MLCLTLSMAFLLSLMPALFGTHGDIRCLAPCLSLSYRHLEGQWALRTEPYRPMFYWCIEICAWLNVHMLSTWKTSPFPYLLLSNRRAGTPESFTGCLRCWWRAHSAERAARSGMLGMSLCVCVLPYAWIRVRVHVIYSVLEASDFRLQQ